MLKNREALLTEIKGKGITLRLYLAIIAMDLKYKTSTMPVTAINRQLKQQKCLIPFISFHAILIILVISKKSLHGQFVLEHGNPDEIKALVDKEAKKLNLTANADGLYDFPLGTVIRYDSSIDNRTYLMLAMAEQDEYNKTHITMVKYDQMLFKMWTEIDKLYASHSIVLPFLGAGITRFDDGPKNKKVLLKCILCTLYNSSVSFNANIKLVIFKNEKGIPLYEYKDLFRTIV